MRADMLTPIVILVNITVASALSTQYESTKQSVET